MQALGNSISGRALNPAQGLLTRICVHCYMVAACVQSPLCPWQPTETAALMQSSTTKEVPPNCNLPQNCCAWKLYLPARKSDGLAALWPRLSVSKAYRVPPSIYSRSHCCLAPRTTLQTTDSRSPECSTSTIGQDTYVTMGDPPTLCSAVSRVKYRLELL